MSGSSRAIGGRSPWGGFVDTICKKYGWTLDYVVWGVSYLNLMMMQADEIAVFSNFSEKQNYNEMLNGDDPTNTETILSSVGQI